MKITEREKKIKKLNKEIAGCRKCKGLNLGKETPSAPGFGSTRARIMLVGQSLHAYNPETPIQIPFQGPKRKADSGKTLDTVFREVSVSKKDLFITNVVHCHPPNNRSSSSREVNNCVPYLIREIYIIKPELIIALGRDARQLMEEKFGSIITYKNGDRCIIRSVPHPAFLLYRRDPDTTEEYIKLLVKLMKRYV